MNDTGGKANRDYVGAVDGQLVFQKTHFKITSIDTKSKVTKTLYNGSFFRREWPVTIVRAVNAAGGEIVAHFYADHGSKNSMYGKVIITDNLGNTREIPACTDNLFY